VENIATYYVTLKPTSVNGVEGKGMTNIAYVPDPAIEEVGIFLEKHDTRIVADEATQKAILDYLETVGIEKPKRWREVTEEEYLSARELNLTTDPTSRESYNDFPNKDGSGQWLVRYEYNGPKDNRNRTFCADMLSLGRIYTEEEIKNGLSNSEFGNYSIFDYKGSYGCRHTWKRMIFFEDYEDDEVRRVGFVPQVVSQLDDREATTLNAFLSKDEKMQVVAPLLIPDKDIFRNDELGRYNMRFTPGTIKDLRTLAQAKGMFERKDLFKDTHEGTTAPSYVLDEWIIEDEYDKAYTEYGFDPKRVPVGSWVVQSQVTDKDYWNKEIKGNKKHAYSIEALMNLTIIKMSKMEEQTIVLPDGEHLINGVIYIVEGGKVIATKEVTPEQEAVVEEVAEAAAETSDAEELEKEKPEEMAAEEKEPEVMMEEPQAPAAEETDRLAKLEKQQEELMSEIAKLRNEMPQAMEEEVKVEMSDKRPMWKRMSDAINAINN
jgi:hypothetical protein